MQAELTNKVVKIDVEGNKKFSREMIPYFLKAAENCDAKTKNEIENHLVRMGEKAIPNLVNLLKSSTGTSRALIAMTLIRIGNTCVESLKSICQNDLQLQWVAEYIINEIEGTKKPLSQGLRYNELTEVLAG